jgi:hypothetical protein
MAVLPTMSFHPNTIIMTFHPVGLLNRELCVHKYQLTLLTVVLNIKTACASGKSETLPICTWSKYITAESTSTMNHRVSLIQ